MDVHPCLTDELAAGSFPYPVDTARSDPGLTSAVGVPASYRVCPKAGTYIEKITLYGDCYVHFLESFVCSDGTNVDVNAGKLGGDPAVFFSEAGFTGARSETLELLPGSLAKPGEVDGIPAYIGFVANGALASSAGNQQQTYVGYAQDCYDISPYEIIPSDTQNQEVNCATGQKLVGVQASGSTYLEVFDVLCGTQGAPFHVHWPHTQPSQSNGR
jgi:hypothetical protein